MVTAMPNVTIEARGLTKWYGSTMAVHKVSFVVQPGKVTGFVAPTARASRPPCG
jgi:ABC-type multidrug transport system ATPase subunit